MILHVLEKATQAKLLDEVVVLTDDERIQNTVEEFGYTAVMTSADCQSGTDRIIEYSTHETEADLFVNIQGDEVLLDPNHIDTLINGFCSDSNNQMATLAHYVSDKNIIADPSTAKIVTDINNNALYFSRLAIPCHQDGGIAEKALIQIGIYIYNRETLNKLALLPLSPLEKIEKLEQLRALENNIAIKIVEVEQHRSLSVDTEQDLERARELLQH